MTAPAPYSDEMMCWKGERAWKAEARKRAIAELEVQLTQLSAVGWRGSVPMLVDAVLGTAGPYLEAAWRDAVAKFIHVEVLGHEGDPAPHAPRVDGYDYETRTDRTLRFLWRLWDPEEGR